MQSPVEVQVRLMKPQTLQADSLPPLVRPSERGIAFTLSEGGTVMQFRLFFAWELYWLAWDLRAAVQCFAGCRVKSSICGHAPKR